MKRILTGLIISSVLLSSASYACSGHDEKKPHKHKHPAKPVVTLPKK